MFRWVLSDLIGHSSIAITEASYGKIIKKNVSDVMMRLNWIYKKKELHLSNSSFLFEEWVNRVRLILS